MPGSNYVLITGQRSFFFFLYSKRWRRSEAYPG